MKRKHFVSILVTVLVMTAMSLACPVPTEEPPEVEPVILRFSFYYTAAIVPDLVWWMDEIEKRTEGRVKFERHWGGALTKPGETPKQLKAGLIDVGALATLFNPGTFVLWEIDASLPFKPSDTRLVNEIKWTLFQEFPELRAELEHNTNGVLMYTSAFGSYEVIANRPLPDLQAYKGLRVAVIGRHMPRWFAPIDAIPVTMIIPDRYPALEMGVIDASSLPIDLNATFKYYELAKHHALIGLGDYAAIAVTMNRNRWNQIPPGDQEIIREVSMQAMLEVKPRLMKERTEAAMERMKEAGVTFWPLSNEDRIRWAQALPNLAQEWVDEARTDEERQVRIRMMERYFELTKEGGHEWPMEWTVK